MLLAAWCGLLALGIFWVQSHLRVSADLRLFMPSPRTEAQRLLIQNIGESPASRLLLLAIDGDQPARIADLSRRYGAALAARPRKRAQQRRSGRRSVGAPSGRRGWSGQR